MTVHLVKLAVGIEDFPHLVRVQKERLAAAVRAGGPATLRHVTRHRPKRAEDILDGGSLYWVIGGAIAARQRVLGFEDSAKQDGTPAIAILLDLVLVPTAPRAFRPFQGWRYLAVDRIPLDSTGSTATGAEKLPAELRRELLDLGLI